MTNRLFLLSVYCALLFLCGCAKTPKIAPLATDAVVLAFGDSLTAGTGADPDKSYPAVLQTLIHRKVMNAGIPGELSSEGSTRLAAVLDEVRPQLLILCHGGNDLLRRTGEAAAEANLRAMVRLAQERGIAVMMIAVPRPGLRLVPPDYYARIAKDAKAPLETDALSSILSNNTLKSDIAHPNAEGYRQMAEAVAALLKKTGAI